MPAERPRRVVQRGPSSRTAAADSAASARAANCRAAPTSVARTTCLAAGIRTAAIESPVTPRQRSRGHATGSPATSPHTATLRPPSAAARATRSIRRSTAGCRASASAATSALPRSAAKTYCARSFVPSEKKSTCGTNASTMRAAAGTSTMIPTSMRSGAAAPERIDVGIMVEVPAAALMVEAFVPHVDFFSLGTNDLAQYVFAADRGNAEVAALADALHPAVLRLIDRVARAAAEGGRSVAVCGEVAGDPLAIPLLLGLGATELSMAAVRIPAAKQQGDRQGVSGHL